MAIDSNTPIWPDALPVPLRAHQRTGDLLFTRTEFDSGRIRKRRIADDPREYWEVTWHFTRDQFEEFKRFFDETLENGSSNFAIEMFGEVRDVEFKESTYTFSHSDNLYAVSSTLMAAAPEPPSCGAQVTTVTLAESAVNTFTVGWSPTNQAINLTIELQVNGGDWAIATTGQPDSAGQFDVEVNGSSGDIWVEPGDTVAARVRRDDTFAQCAIESATVASIDFFNFPNDSFENYIAGEDLKDKNGGEHGHDPIIVWQGDYQVWPFGDDDLGAIDPNHSSVVSNLVQWAKADAILGLSNGDPLSTWEDQTANNNDFTAAGAQRPTYQTNQLNGMAGVLFSSTPGVGMTGPYSFASGGATVIAVFRSNNLTSTATRRLVQGAANWMMGPYGGQNRIFHGGDFLYGSYPTIEPVVMAVTQNATTEILAYLNGARFGRGTSGLVFPGLIHLGATGGFNEPADAHLFEIVVYSRVLTEAEVFGVSWGLMLRWGVATTMGFES